MAAPSARPAQSFRGYSPACRTRAEDEAEMILRSAVVLIALLVSSAAQVGYMTYQKWSDMPEVYTAKTLS